LPVIRCPDGRTISGSILGQLNFVLKEATNHHRFGVKVRDILNEGYTKQYNPYIRSFKSAKEYYGIWKNLVLYVKQEFGINRLDLIQPQHVEDFIEERVALSPKQLRNISSAVGKLEAVLRERFSLSVSYGDRELQTGRWLANKIASEMECSSQRGSYENPRELVEALSNPSHRLVAELQWKGGFRIHEVAGIRPESFTGDGITVKGKGGYVRTVTIPGDLLERAREVVESSGRIDFSYREYLKDLRETSIETAQSYQGSHGLRYNYAQDRYGELIERGYGHTEALKVVSEELGHHRPEITLHYLGR